MTPFKFNNTTYTNSTAGKGVLKVNATESDEYPLIVSNDLTRDHRQAFDQPRGFARWRASQLILFRIMQPVDHPLTLEDIELKDPKQYSREVQRGSVSWRWHFPIADRRAWLCLNLLPAD